MRILGMIFLLSLMGCAGRVPSQSTGASATTVYDTCMRGVTSRCAGHLWQSGCLVVEKKPERGFVRAYSVAPAPVMPGEIYTFPAASINPYKVDHIVMGNHEIASCTTTFWNPAK